MNKIGTISGVKAIFGGRWDDAKGSARLKSKLFDTTVFYDKKEIGKKIYPAPAVVHQLIEVDDSMAVYALFYTDDEGGIFASVIFSSGRVAPLSEKIYADQEEWEIALREAVIDGNVDSVHFPKGAIDSSEEKLRPYEVAEGKIHEKDLPKISSSSSIGTILVILVMLLVLAAIPIGAWVFIAKPFDRVEEVIYRTEQIKPDFSAVLNQCALDLDEPWSAPPEWTLRQEGCVIAPELARIGFPKPADQRPYAYRFYDLNGQHWDDFLSRASFLKMAERFPGHVLEGTNQFVLYIPYDVERDIIDDAYTPHMDPATILRQNFVGAIKLNNGGAGGSIQGITDLELDRTIVRLSGERLTPIHISRNLGNSQTDIEVSSERIETRQVRVK